MIPTERFIERVTTLTERPDLRPPMSDLHNSAWPRFLQHDDLIVRYWSRMLSACGKFQFMFLSESGTVVALGNTIPIAWNGTVEDLPKGIDGALQRGMAERPGEADTLCALAAIVAADYRGQGLSARVIEAMRAAAAVRGLRALIAPVRPIRKHLYPLTPMERYIRWVRADGAPFDPWTRVHWRLGAEYLGIADRSMVVRAPVARWEEWTGMQFPESGEYIISGALVPVRVDVEHDLVSYEEPNVWMRHSVRP